MWTHTLHLILGSHRNIPDGQGSLPRVFRVRIAYQGTAACRGGQSFLNGNVLKGKVYGRQYTGTIGEEDDRGAL